MPEKAARASPVPLCKLLEESVASAPVLYFDQITTFGFNAGVASVTLETIVFLAAENGIEKRRRIVGHLRMSPNALASLKKAIEGIELLAQPTQRRKAN